jgi:hypothetical protein
MFLLLNKMEIVEQLLKVLPMHIMMHERGW